MHVVCNTRVIHNRFRHICCSTSDNFIFADRIEKYINTGFWIGFWIYLYFRKGKLTVTEKYASETDVLSLLTALRYTTTVYCFYLSSKPKLPQNLNFAK